MLSLTLSQGLFVNCLIPRLNLDNSSSNFKTLTLMFVLISSISEGELILVQDMSVT